LREPILVASENVALADAYVVVPENPRRNWFAQRFWRGRWHTFVEEPQSLIDQNPEQPTAELTFMFKQLCMTRSCAPATFYGFFRALRAPKDTTCNEVKHTVAAPESGIKGQLLLIELPWLREDRPRALSEMMERAITFAVRHAWRLALVAKSVL
jgi:hypothetical protein